MYYLMTLYIYIYDMIPLYYPIDMISITLSTDSPDFSHILLHLPRSPTKVVEM